MDTNKEKRLNQHNPYAAPKASVRDFDDDARANIDELPVSETWKNRFHLIETAGGTTLPKIKDLSFGDRSRVMFNLLAFLFGPFYYLAKGLWRKAITYFLIAFVIVVALMLVLDYLGFDAPDRAASLGLAAFFAIRANIDYYKRMVLKRNGWL